MAVKALLVLILLRSTFGNLTTTENILSKDGVHQMEYSEGTSVEATYSLPPVNISVSGANNSTQVVRASLARLLDFYNTELLAANFPRFKNILSQSCQKDINAYIQGLMAAENWALKMDDASGRYSTGWFWGNSYWVGSQNLCEHINPKKQIIIISQNHSRSARAADASLKLHTPGLSMGYKPGSIVFTNGAPFPVSFFKLRLHLNSSFTTEERILHLGLCLPHACSANDAQKIMEETSASSSKITVKVELVRSEHNRYNFMTDSTFIALSITTGVIVFMLILGTAFDYYLEHLKNCNLKEKNCAHFNGKLDMPDLKAKNGIVGRSQFKFQMSDSMHEEMSVTHSQLIGLYVVNNNNNTTSDDHTRSLDLSSSNASNSQESLTKFVLKEMLLSFSVRINMGYICDQTVGSDTISVIHGLKAISMAWVVLGHTCIVAFKYSDNMEFRRIVQKEFLFQTVTNGTFSVDTFFFCSGLLVSFLYFRTNAKGKLASLNKGNGFIAGVLHFLGLVFYRFARLTFPYLFTLGIVEVTMKWFAYNSVFEPPTNDHLNCPNYWWRNILYINTLFPVNQMCMLWSWYLSDDTQFYVVGAIILILATSHFKSAAAILMVFMTSSWITTGYIAYSNSHMPGSDDPLALFDKIYDKPWTRLGPYLIGMCTGWFLFKKNCQLQMTKIILAGGWILSIGTLLSLVYGLYEAQLTPWIGAAYSSLSHSAWALALAWIVIACVTGYGGPVDKILSATILYPFSRVTYCAYLVHPIAIRMMVMYMDSPLHLGSVITVIIYLGQMMLSYILSFFVSVAFEAPIVSLLRIISKVFTERKPSTSNNNNHAS